MRYHHNDCVVADGLWFIPVTARFEIIAWHPIILFVIDIFVHGAIAIVNYKIGEPFTVGYFTLNEPVVFKVLSRNFKMKSKILNISLILTSLMGYLEWGKDSKIFLFQAEMEIISKFFTNPLSVIHPFTLLPLFGQLLLLYTLFQKRPGKKLTLIGFWSIGLLLLFMFIIGIISLNYKIFISTIPFLITGILTILHHRKQKQIA